MCLEARLTCQQPRERTVDGDRILSNKVFHQKWFSFGKFHCVWLQAHFFGELYSLSQALSLQCEACTHTRPTNKSSTPNAGHYVTQARQIHQWSLTVRIIMPPNYSTSHHSHYKAGDGLTFHGTNVQYVLYVCMHVRMYVCIYVCTYTYVCTYVHRYISTYVCT